MKKSESRRVAGDLFYLEMFWELLIMDKKKITWIGCEESDELLPHKPLCKGFLHDNKIDY